MADRSRRTVLATSALALAGVAGCLGEPEPGRTNDTAPDAETNGSPNESERITRSFLEVEVPFVQPEQAHEWWAAESATFGDARSAFAYDQAHISGAVSSPAPDGQPNTDPLAALDPDDRIVTYCTCPYHLAGQRAATLIDQGYTNVYALDHGFQHWYQAYPDAVALGEDEPVQQSIEGTVASAHAGSTVWIREPATGQREVTTVAPDGTFGATIHFYDVGPSTRLTVKTATYSLEAPLSTLATRPVTADLAEAV